MVLGTSSFRLEKGKYSYDVATLIERLSNLPPRGSIARCLELYRNRLSLPDYALVYKEFARRGDWQRLLRLFKYMQRQSWCRPDEHLHAIIIGVLGREGLLDRCLELFDRDMPANSVPRTALSYTALINAFARNGDHNTALSLLDRMKTTDRVAPTVLTYNTVLHACARAIEDVGWDVMLGLFAQMRHDGVRPDLATYNTLLAACAARGLGDEAEMVFRTMNEAGVSPEPTTHSYLVETFARLDRLPRVSELLREMEDAGNVPDAASYNVLLEAYARVGDAPAAIGVLRQMQAAGCAPNAPTYSILLGLYGKSGKYEDMRELFLEMKVENTAPDVSTYNILVRVFGEGGYFREAVTLFYDMVDEKVEASMETYEGFVFACGKGGLYQDARKILLHMNDKGIVPSSKTFDGVIEAYGHAAQYEEAIVAFNTMNEIGSTPTLDTYNAMLHMFAAGGLFKECQSVLDRIFDAEFDKNVDTYNCMIECYCQAGLFEESVKVYAEMQDYRCPPNKRTLEALLKVSCTAGLVDESRERFLEIKSLGITPSIISYCLLLSLYAKNDRWDEAYQLLDEMQNTTASNIHQVIGAMIKGDYDDEANWQMVEYAFDTFNPEGCGFGLRFYNTILEALWWLGQRARAKRVLDEATRRGLFPELHRDSKFVWSVDVHRMSIGASLLAISTWLKDMRERFEGGEDLPHLASIVVARGEVEKSPMGRSLPVSKAAYTYLRDKLSASFSFPGWTRGRMICQRHHLKRLLSSERLSAELLAITDIEFPAPGTILHTSTMIEGDGHISGSEGMEEPLLETAAH